MLSGIANTQDHFQGRINKEIKKFGGTEELIDVSCYTLDRVLKDNQVKKVDFCSIDVEGHELEVLQSIDFDVVKIDIFVIENSVGDNKLKRFLKPLGYKHIMTLDHCDLIFLRKDSSYPYEGKFIERFKWNRQLKSNS